MKFLFCTAFCLSLITTWSFADWPQQKSDLKVDPKATFGQLSNGLRYIILPHAEPPGRASIRLYMDVGSLMEEDDQQGMAHYLEHMAFNGSRHFPGGEMVEYFQRLGMGFGADTNAHTSFKETVYMLELPQVEQKLITEGMQLFRDYLDGMALGEKEIDKERGIILSEKLSRDSIEYRTSIAGYEFAMPESLLPKRLPIGIEQTLKTMQRPRFVDFYQKWYTPKRAMIVAVGDFKEINSVKEAIEINFSDAKAAQGDSPDPSFGKISTGRGLITKLHTEMEAKSVTLSIEIVRPAKNEADTAATRREKMVRDLADAMLNLRFSELAKAEKAPILSAESYSYEYLEFVKNTGAMAECAPEMWQQALGLLEKEVRRAVQHGFTDAEFDEAKASLLKNLELRAAQADSRKSRDLASGLVTVLASNKVFTHPQDDLLRVKSALKNLTKEECHRAFTDSWKSSEIQIFVGGKLKLEGAAEALIRETYLASTKEEVAAPAKEENLTFAYTTFGAAGEVQKTEKNEELGITLAQLSNEVRVNIKPTPFEKGTVRVTLSFGGGKLTAPLDKAGLIPFAQSTFILGGLEKHSADDLRRLFASKTVGMDFNVGDEAFTLSGRTTPTDLEAQLQLLAAFLVAPGYREEAERQFRKNIEPMYIELQNTAEGLMNDRVVSLLHGGDIRFGFPPQSELEKRQMADLAQWLKTALQNEYLEVSIVGDIEPAAALEAVKKTIGALPKRAAQKPDYVQERQIKFPAPGKTELKFSTEIPKAIASLYWPTGDMLDIQRTRRLILLASILDDRLRIKVREELGETYSPACYHVANDTFKGYGYLTAMIECKPEQAEPLSVLVKSIAHELASGEITDDEFERAKKPILSQLDQMRRDNRYWAQNVVRNCQEHPERLQWAKSLVEDFSGIQKGDLSKLAKTYLEQEKAVNVQILPEVKK